MAAIDDKPARRDVKKMIDRAETLRKRTKELQDEVINIEQKSQDRLASATVLMEKAQKLRRAHELYEEARKKSNHHEK